MDTKIPKFASFRPKPKAPVEIPKSAEPENLGRPGKTLRRPEKSSHSSKEKAPRAVNDKRDRIPEQENQRPYFIDRKGDILNLTYGSLNRYKIPAYRRCGYGCIMGVPSDRRIDRELTTDQEIVLTPATNRRQERLLTSKHVGGENARSLRFVRRIGDPQPTPNSDYITLSSPAKRKRDADEDPHDVDYRSSKGRSDPAELSDPDTKYESGTELDDADAGITQKNATLTRRTREYPRDSEGWLSLIDHQKAMLRLGRSSTGLNTSDKQHLADVRISIYEQAIRKIGDDQTSQIKLHAGLMAEARLSWDDAKMTSKWAEVLVKFSRSLELWTQYLDFVETSFVSYKYENCRSTFHECLRAFQSSPDIVPSEVYLYVMMRLTSMIQQAGYQELALAMWQALLEFNLLPPTPGASGHEDDGSLRSFEEFWDSEVARIGESNAKGWRVFDAEADASTSAGTAIPRLSDSLVPTLESFHKHEIEHMAGLRYPGRTTDEVGEDDPFHLILFSDIEEFVKVLPQDTPKALVLEAFLCFCRLPPLPRMAPYQQRWWTDPFLRYEDRDSCMHSDRPTSFIQFVAKLMECPIHHFQITLELLFDQAFPENTLPIDIAAVRRVLKLLVADTTSDEVFGEYLLALEFKYFTTEVFKTAKQILKSRPTSLGLYNAYGLVESRRGNSAKADQVFAAALSMQTSSTPLSKPGSLQLFNNWVWEALSRGEPDEALWRLVSPKGDLRNGLEGGDEHPDQTALLRGRLVLDEGNERALLGKDYTSAVICTALLAMLAYLSGGRNPEVALKVHNRLSTWFSSHDLSHSPFAELHAQSISQFLTYHTTHTPIVKPSLLRTSVEPLIAIFPSNTILLSLYAANEARFSVDDRVRGIMSQNILHSDRSESLATCFFGLHFETLRGEIASTSHSVRALFKKAQAEGSVGAHSVALWRRHIFFELQELHKEKTKRTHNKKPRKDGKKRTEELVLEESTKRVRDTFFEGLTRLPWSKEYMMLAFTHLREEVLTQEELRKVYNVMIEKELRIYVDLDER